MANKLIIYQSHRGYKMYELLRIMKWDVSELRNLGQASVDVEKIYLKITY